MSLESELKKNTAVMEVLTASIVDLRTAMNAEQPDKNVDVPIAPVKDVVAAQITTNESTSGDQPAAASTQEVPQVPPSIDDMQLALGAKAGQMKDGGAAVFELMKKDYDGAELVTAIDSSLWAGLLEKVKALGV